MFSKQYAYPIQNTSAGHLNVYRDLEYAQPGSNAPGGHTNSCSYCNSTLRLEPRYNPVMNLQQNPHAVDTHIDLDDEFKKNNEFYRLNQDILRPPIFVNLDILLNQKTLSYFDDCLSAKIPLLVYFFKNIQSVQLRKYFVYIFSQYIVGHLKSNSLCPSYINSKLSFSVISCCLLLCHDNLELANRSIHQFFLNEYRYDMNHKRILSFKSTILYDYFFCFFFFSHLLSSRKNKEPVIYDIVLEYTRFFCDVFSREVAFSSNCTDELDTIRTIQHLNQYSSAEKISHIAVHFGNIAKYMLDCFFCYYPLNIIVKEIDRIELIMKNVSEENLFRQEMKKIKDRITENLDETIFSPRDNALIIQKYNEFLILLKNHSCAFFRKIKSNDENVKETLSVINISPLILIEIKKIVEIKKKIEKLEPSIRKKYDSIFNSVENTIHNLRSGSSNYDFLSFNLIKNFLRKLEDRTEHFVLLELTDQLENRLNQALDDLQQKYGNKSTFPVVFFVIHKSNTCCFVVDFGQKIAMVDPELPNFILHRLGEFCNIVRFPEDLTIDKNTMLCFLFTVRLALCLLKSEYIFLMKEIYIHQNQPSENHFVRFFETCLRDKIRKYKCCFSDNDGLLHKNNYANNSFFRTAANYPQLFKNENSSFFTYINTLNNFYTLKLLKKLLLIGIQEEQSLLDLDA